jgi:hypothetical protein
MAEGVKVEVQTTHHRMFGPMVRLIIANGPDITMTPLEAMTLSKALAALAEGRSKAKDIYMSPIASDGDLSIDVWDEGLKVEDGPLLPWAEAPRLSRALAAAAGEPVPMQ